MRTVNAVGDACPIPVVKTKRALETLEKPDMVEVLVDNETAVQNVTKFAVQAGKKVSSQKLEEHRYQILIDCTKENIKTERPKDREADQSDSRTVVVVSSDRMGSGDEELGTVLMKGFLFALTQLTELPGKILFYNGGARLTCKGSESVEEMCIRDRDSTMSVVAKKLKITAGSLTTAVNSLVNKKYVTRLRGEEDRRVVYIRLTEQGKRAYRHHEEFHRQMTNLSLIHIWDSGSLYRSHM